MRDSANEAPGGQPLASHIRSAVSGGNRKHQLFQNEREGNTHPQASKHGVPVHDEKKTGTHEHGHAEKTEHPHSHPDAKHHGPEEQHQHEEHDQHSHDTPKHNQAHDAHRTHEHGHGHN